MDKKPPMSKTEINHLVGRHLHVSSQEAARLVSNAIRDGILTEIAIVQPEKRTRGKLPKKYIIVRHASDIDSEVRELW